MTRLPTDAETHRRQQVAEREAQGYPPQPMPINDAQESLKMGVCVITDNTDDDGTYTIGELWWNPGTEAWESAVEPFGHAPADARDVNNRTSGQIGQRVPFWEERDRTGQIRLMLNVFEKGDDTWIEIDSDGVINHIGPHDQAYLVQNDCLLGLDLDAKGHVRRVQAQAAGWVGPSA